MSNTALQKLSYYTKEIKIRRGNVIFKEGDNADGIYLVRSGEFEKTKIYTKDPVASHNNIKFRYEMRCAIIGPREIIGLKEIKNNILKRQYGIRCISSNGVVYFISK